MSKPWPTCPSFWAKGVPYFRAQGTEKSPGTKIFCLSGRVKNPGNYELPLGTTFRELIFNYGGGILNDANDQSHHAGRCFLLAHPGH